MNTDERFRGSSQVSSRTVWTIGLNLLAMIVIILIIYRTRDIFLLLIGSLVLTGAVNPIVVWLERKGMKRGLAVLSLFAVGTILLGLSLFSFVPIFEDQVGKLVGSAPELLERFQENSFFEWANRRFNLTDLLKGDLQDYGKDIGLIFFGFLKGLFKGAFGVVTIIIVTIFMLIFGKELLTKGMVLLRPGRRSRTLSLMQDLQKTVGGYVVGTLLIAFIGGVVITVTLLILGVPYFLPLGLLTAILGLIPYIGPVIAAVLIVATTLATAGLTPGIVTGIVFILYQQLENHLLQPVVQRRTIQMNPLIIVVVMLLGTSLAGIAGAVLALPVAGGIQVFLKEALQNATGSE
jgi:predicted PurR-regulated permease PerM